MPTKKLTLDEKKREAELASEEQMNDLSAAILSLGASSANTESSRNGNTSEMHTETASPARDFKTVTTFTETKPQDVQNTEAEQKDDKPGYVSLVIPNSLKKKWKLYSTVHGMSLTDSLKLGMKLLEEMEQKGKIRIEGGFLTING